MPSVPLISCLNNVLDIYLTAIKVGVPVVPGTPGPVAAYTEAESFIKEYGFPGLSSLAHWKYYQCAEPNPSHHQGSDGRRGSWYEGCSRTI